MVKETRIDQKKSIEYVRVVDEKTYCQLFIEKVKMFPLSIKKYKEYYFFNSILKFYKFIKFIIIFDDFRICNNTS